MPCRELRFVLSVVFYVVNENLQNRIRSKSCKKQKKTPETVGFQVLFWSCWADSNRRPHPYQGCALPTELQQHNVATKKGLEPSTSSVTGWRSNQLNYLAIYAFVLKLKLAYYSKCGGKCQHPFPDFLAKISVPGGRQVCRPAFLTAPALRTTSRTAPSCR